MFCNYVLKRWRLLLVTFILALSFIACNLPGSAQPTIDVDGTHTALQATEISLNDIATQQAAPTQTSMPSETPASTELPLATSTDTPTVQPTIEEMASSPTIDLAVTNHLEEPICQLILSRYPTTIYEKEVAVLQNSRIAVDERVIYSDLAAATYILVTTSCESQERTTALITLVESWELDLTPDSCFLLPPDLNNAYFTLSNESLTTDICHAYLTDLSEFDTERYSMEDNSIDLLTKPLGYRDMIRLEDGINPWYYVLTVHFCDGSEILAASLNFIEYNGAVWSYLDHETSCGNEICEIGEDPISCDLDCNRCGDGYCDESTDPDSCPADCEPKWWESYGIEE